MGLLPWLWLVVALFEAEAFFERAPRPVSAKDIAIGLALALLWPAVAAFCLGVGLATLVLDVSRRKP